MCVYFLLFVGSLFGRIKTSLTTFVFFMLQDSPKRAPRQPKTAPREPQELLGFPGLQDSPKTAQESSKRAPREPKAAPGASQESLKTAQRAQRSMKKTNVSIEVLILPNNLAKSRPRSKHSYSPCVKDECFERGLDFTEQPWKIKTSIETFVFPQIC